MTRIKCCGVTRSEDAVLAARLGVDAVGMVFTARSPRRVTVAQAQAIVRALPPFATSVALFMDDAEFLVREVVESVRPSLLQFHGHETDAWCAQFDHPFVKAVAMGEGAPALEQLSRYPRAAALLLDGHVPGEPGGAGRRFDWSLVPPGLTQPLILAGGLNAANVAAGIHALHPWAVDVSSAVELAPGIKDPDKLATFIRAVRDTDQA